MRFGARQGTEAVGATQVETYRCLTLSGFPTIFGSKTLQKPKVIFEGAKL